MNELEVLRIGRISTRKMSIDMGLSTFSGEIRGQGHQNLDLLSEFPLFFSSPQIPPDGSGVLGAPLRLPLRPKIPSRESRDEKFPLDH